MISLAEAQELHELIGAAYELGDTRGLRRAREIAAIIVSDLMDCEECGDAIITGVRYPTHPNDDDTRAWIERCDACHRFENDERAAEALVQAGAINAYDMATPAGCITPTPYAKED